MAAKHQFVSIDLPAGLSKEDKTAIGLDVLQHIRERSKKEHKDKNGKPFPKYSKEYIKSLAFHNAGKSARSVDLTLSGDMLAAMKMLPSKTGELVIGFEKGTPENARADGNIRGTYGQDKPNPSKARDFLGIEDKMLTEIIDEYDLNSGKAAVEKTAKNSLGEILSRIGEKMDKGLLKQIILDKASASDRPSINRISIEEVAAIFSVVRRGSGR